MMGHRVLHFGTIASEGQELRMREIWVVRTFDRSRDDSASPLSIFERFLMSATITRASAKFSTLAHLFIISRRHSA